MKKRFYYLLSVITLLTTHTVNAFDIIPVSSTLETSGIKSEQVYLVTNKSPKPVAITFFVTSRDHEYTGKEIRTSADHLFDIYPSKAIVPSGGTQKVKLKWLGKKSLQHEEAYRFIAKQLPINLSEKSAMNLNIVMTVVGALYVKPSETINNQPQTIIQQSSHQHAPSLNIIESHVKQTKNGKKLVLVIENRANHHVIIESAELVLKTGQQQITLKPHQLQGLLKQNILAKTTQQFTLKAPEELDPNQSWTAQLNLI